MGAIDFDLVTQVYVDTLYDNMVYSFYLRNKQGWTDGVGLGFYHQHDFYLHTGDLVDRKNMTFYQLAHPFNFDLAPFPPFLDEREWLQPIPQIQRESAPITLTQVEVAKEIIDQRGVVKIAPFLFFKYQNAAHLRRLGEDGVEIKRSLTSAVTGGDILSWELRRALHKILAEGV